MACDITVAADTAVLGQSARGTASAPDGGSTDFLPGTSRSRTRCGTAISCEMWSAYKMKLKGLISRSSRPEEERSLPPQPLVVTDRYVDDGESSTRDEDRVTRRRKRRRREGGDRRLRAARRGRRQIVWRFTNLFPAAS